MIGTRNTGWLARIAVVCAVVLGAATSADAKKKPAPGPDAAQVIVRGRTLADALEIACQPAWADAKKLRPVVVVLDVTPNIKASGERIGKAFSELAKRGRKAKEWRLARLGSKPGKPSRLASDLGGRLQYVYAKSVRGRSTITLLRASLKSVRKNSVVVYLADWRFEDDFELEALVKLLRKKKITFSVVGSETAFGRGWDDGIRTGDDMAAPDTSRGDDPFHFDDIGRNPFGGTEEAPWHGGEVAFPGIPYRWAWSHWDTEFDDYDWSFSGLSADSSSQAKKSHRDIPLPSAFGPYGLMRAAGESGGRYVLAGWGSGGRRHVKYDYARCNLLGPDLRARKDILADLKRNRYLRATLAAWHILMEAKDDIIEVKPPLEADLKTPGSVDTLAGLGELHYIWDDEGKYKGFTRAAPAAIEVLDRAIKRLDDALQGDDVPTDLRRYEADARLMAHVCRVARFETAECIQAATKLPKDLWKKKGTRPGLLLLDWIEPGRDPDKPKFGRLKDPWDQVAADALLAERASLLRRFRGTPWGEQLAMNNIESPLPNWWDKTKPGRYRPDKRKRPKPPPPARPGGGSSSGGGPTTGGG